MTHLEFHKTLGANHHTQSAKVNWSFTILANQMMLMITVSQLLKAFQILYYASPDPLRKFDQSAKNNNARTVNTIVQL